MSDYFIATATFVNPLGSPSPSQPDNSTFIATASFAVFGSKAGAILNRETTAWQITPTEIAGGTGQGASLASITWNGNIAHPAINVRGGYTPGTPSVSTGVYYTDYTYPAIPPDSATYDVRFYIMSSSAASGSSTMYVNIAFTPDMYAAGFNPLMTNASTISDWIINVDQRENPAQEIEVEWHSDSAFTSLVTTNLSFIISSGTNTDVSYWVRYRNLGSSDPWTLPGGTGELHWTDPRKELL